MNILRFIIPKSLVEYITSDSTVRQGLEKMKYHRYAAIPVLDGEGHYIGTLRNDDILKFFLEVGAVDFRLAERASVMDIIGEHSPKPLLHSAGFDELFDTVREHNFVSVVDDRGCFMGLILRRDVMNYLWEQYKKSDN